MNTAELKLGVVGLDGHGPVFADQVNGANGSVNGMRVATAMPVPSVMVTADVLKENTEKTRALGIDIVERPDELAADVDGILILHDDGAKHLELAKQFARFGKPLFVDKPLEAGVEKARELVNLCRAEGAALFTGSALRFSVELQNVQANSAGGRILSAMAYSPFVERPTMPGWIYYAIHAVEPLFELLGPDCRQVRCNDSESGPVAIGTWDGGRIGIARAFRGDYSAYGLTVWRENSAEAATVDLDLVYGGLLKQIKAFVQTGVSPAAPDESVRVIAFLESANESMANDGRPVALK